MFNRQGFRIQRHRFHYQYGKLSGFFPNQHHNFHYQYGKLSVFFHNYHHNCHYQYDKTIRVLSQLAPLLPLSIWLSGFFHNQHHYRYHNQQHYRYVKLSGSFTTSTITSIIDMVNYQVSFRAKTTPSICTVVNCQGSFTTSTITSGIYVCVTSVIGFFDQHHHTFSYPNENIISVSQTVNIVLVG